jgi:TolB protein
MKKLNAISRVVLWMGALGIVAASALAWAQSPPQISGTTTQITTNPAGQFNPAISGTVVTYTSLQNGGNPNVYYTDISTGIETQVTNATGFESAELPDVLGNTIVYAGYGSPTVAGGVLGYTIGGAALNSFNIAVNPDYVQTSPGIGSGDGTDSAGPIVAWETTQNGSLDIYAEDLSTGTTKQITANGGVNNSRSPNVSNGVIAYLTQTSTSCQVFVTNFYTLATTELTNTASGCNTGIDISGALVTYVAYAGGTPYLYVYDLTTNVETQATTTGSPQNPHISGDWVSFENVSTDSSGSYSSIYLYNVPSGNLYTAVQGISPSNSAFLNDIDGFRVAYTGNSTGVDQVYVFQFTPEIQFASFSAIPVIFPKTGAFAVGGEFTLGTGGAVNLPSNSVTLQLGGFSTTIPAGSFQVDRLGTYEFQGTINGVTLIAAIQPLSASEFAYGITGDGASGLPTANPVNVELTVGDNSGSASVKAIIF